MIAKLASDRRVREAAAIADTFSMDPRTYLSAPLPDRMLLLAALKAVSDANKKAVEDAKKNAKPGRRR